MICRLTVSFLILLATTSIYTSADDSFPGDDIYLIKKPPVCVQSFTKDGETFTDCTTVGDNGPVPWCSLTPVYIGLFAPCVDFHKPNLKCQKNFTVNGKLYTGCAVISKSAVYPQCKSDNSNYPYMYCAPGMNKTNPYAFKIRPDCDPIYKRLSPTHTMCYGASDFAVPIKITDDEKQALLDMHNSYRSAVPSEYMFELGWDDELATVAQARSNLCGFDHDMADNRMTPSYQWKCGQNMVMAGGIRNPYDSLIDMMLGAEKENFIYGVGCTSPGNCLHYTQAMKSNLTRVGCGVAHCVYPDSVYTLLTCNYDQSQYTSKYMRPYEESTVPASSCPAKNNSGLCQCPDAPCSFNLVDGPVPNTCSCSPDGRSKRSLVKRDIEERSIENGRPYMAVEKRSLKKRQTNDKDLFVAVPKGSLEKRQTSDGSLFVAVPKGDLESDKRKKRFVISAGSGQRLKNYRKGQQQDGIDSDSVETEKRGWGKSIDHDAGNKETQKRGWGNVISDGGEGKSNY